MTLIVGVICPEGIVLAGDSKSTIEKEVTDPQTGEKRIEQSGFVTTSDNMPQTTCHSYYVCNWKSYQ